MSKLKAFSCVATVTILAGLYATTVQADNLAEPSFVSDDELALMEKAEREERLRTRAILTSDWLQHYSSILKTVGNGEGNNDSATAEETTDPYTDEKSYDISLVADDSDYELIFSCDFTNKTVSVVAIGKNLKAMKTAEIGLYPNPVTPVTKDTHMPNFYKPRGDWAVASKRVIPNGDHGVIVGAWGGKYINACRDNGEFRNRDALYCSRANTKTLESRFDNGTLSKVNAPSQFFDLRAWSDFEAVKLSVLDGTQYIFSQTIYPRQEPFKSFFTSCTSDTTQVFATGFFEGTPILTPSLAAKFEGKPEMAQQFFYDELLNKREFSGDLD